MTDVLAAELGSELYDFLDGCSNEELTPIVDALASSPESVLATTRRFELHQPEHDRYTDLIGDEIHRLGNAALGRKERVRASTAAFLAAISKQIGIPAEVQPDALTLVNLFATRHLMTVPPDRRAPLIDEACKAAGAGTAGMLSSDAWPPFAAALLHVAMLQAMHPGRGRALPVPIGTDDEAGGTNAVFVGSEGDPLFAITTVRSDSDTGWELLTEAGRIAHNLGPLLEAAQPFLSARKALGDGNVYRAVLPTGVGLSWSNKIGAYVGSAKKNKGQVPFEKVTLTSMLGPAAIPLLLNAYLQKQQADQLEESLQYIKRTVDSIASFQNEERRSAVRGAIRYFQQVASAVLGGETAAEFLTAIEQHEMKLVQTQEHIEADLAKQVAVLRGAKKEGWGSGSKFVKTIEETQVGLEGLFDEAMLCLRARTIGYRILCAFPGREHSKRLRHADIGGAVEALSATGDLAVTVDHLLREKTAGFAIAGRAAILARASKTFERLEATVINLQGALHGSATADASRQGVAIDLKVENGKVAGLRLSSAAVSLDEESISATIPEPAFA